VNTPFLLLGATIAFWGWQTGQWLVAAVCAAVFEGARFVAHRWSLTPEQLSRISDLCVVLAGILFASLYATLGNSRAITQLFLWLPFAFLPLALAQAYGTQREIELGALFWSMRRMSRRKPTYVNLGYAYAAAWIVAASAANRRDELFDLGLIALAAWALWQVRPRSRSVALWLVLVPLAGGLSYVGHNGLRNLQLWLEANAAQWLRGDGGSNTDPYRADTDIGHIGSLKQSERIVMRVRTGTILLRPLLLHRASYVSYTGLRWLAKNAAFSPVVPSDNAGVWPLEPDGDGASMQTASIVEQTDQSNPVLSLPAGTRRVDGLLAGDMKRNTLGAVQIEHGPGFVAYRALYLPGGADAAGPSADDLIVPRREAEVLHRIVDELGLKTMPPADALAAVERYFSANFSYSLYRAGESGAATPLADFLLRTHAGHCEYFATATVLLLRAAGIPARYATGFSVQEWSEFESAYLVRERHAHAWARVWVDGVWRELDTTPAVWSMIEAQDSPWWSRLADYVSWLRLKFSELRSHEGEVPVAWMGIAALLLLWFVWRLFGKSAKPDQALHAAAPAALEIPGTDSAFYRIEAFLATRCAQRTASETMREWLTRIAPHLSQVPARDELAALLDLHYRLRFDPAGVSAAERSQFLMRVETWLAHART
jgi:hypothetical protein